MLAQTVPSLFAGFRKMFATERPAAAPRSRQKVSRLFLIEFNELCPQLLDQFIGEGKLPNFQRFRASSEVFTTDAGESADHLEPWIQWPSVHSGQSFAEHRVFHLGDGRSLAAKCLAEVLSEAGCPVGVCGSMNTNYRHLNGYVVPDPWDRKGEAWPLHLQDFSRTLGRLVQESSRSTTSKRDLLQLGWFLVRHGLSFDAARMAGIQLLAERRDPGLNWRRACVLDRFLYDLFRHLNAKHRVRFGTFFCNSTAHFQHYYWRHMCPEQFDAPPPAEDSRTLGSAIVTGYQAMDRLLGYFLRDYADARLILCTALSQQPWTDTNKCTYRPRKFDELFAFAGCTVDHDAAEPVMAEQFHIRCGGVQQAQTTEARLRDLCLDDGEPLMIVKREGDKLFAGCRITAGDCSQRFVVCKATGASMAFDRLFYRLHTLRSGRHHPDGVLWVRSGKYREHTSKVPLTAIAPTVLKHFGIAPPATMRTHPLDV